MTGVCPTCHQPRPGTHIQWHGLRVEDSPLTAYWEGKRLLLTRTQIKLLIPLVRTGRAEATVLWGQLSDSTDLKTVSVHLTEIRKRFAREDVPIRIKSEHGWGYRLELEQS